MLKEGVSIIICCYNSSLRIERTLRHIANQQINDIDCELILVDNASSDDTVAVAKSAWLKTNNHKIAFVTTHENMSGLSNARQKGVGTANYEYLVFCDDDNWLDKNYIKNTFAFFKSNPDVGILGGVGTPEFEDPNLKPLWFDTLYHGYAVGVQAENECFVNGVYGAGMAVRKSVLITVMDKRPMLLSDRNKKALSAGGDGEICMRVRLAGYKILYSPQLKFKHFLSSDRLSWDHLKKLHIGFAKCSLVLNLYDRALTLQYPKLPVFYWLEKGLYYWGIYLKYWPKHFVVYKNGEGSLEELRHLTWKYMALNYFKHNFQTIKLYRQIIALNKK